MPPTLPFDMSCTRALAASADGCMHLHQGAVPLMTMLSCPCCRLLSCQPLRHVFDMRDSAHPPLRIQAWVAEHLHHNGRSMAGRVAEHGPDNLHGNRALSQQL